jgi:hypothetical protein
VASAAIVALAADPAFPTAVALVKGPAAQWLLMTIGAGRVDIHPLPLAVAPLHLLLTAADHVLVGEVAHRPGDPRPTFFREYLLKPAGPEAERGFAVRGFDGRALWREAGGDGRIMASTAAGARALYPREPALAGSGVVETWALDSGIFGCVWHRLFADLCLPADCAITIEAKTADDLPPFDLRRPPACRWTRPATRAPRPSTTRGRRWARSPPTRPKAGSASASPTRARPTPTGPSPTASPSALARPAGQPAPALGHAASRNAQPRVPDHRPARPLPVAAHPARRHPPPGAGPVRAAGHLPAPVAARLPARLLAFRPGRRRRHRARPGPLRRLDDRARPAHRRAARAPRPRLVPAEALPWLASFLALSFDARVREGVRRQLLQDIASLYRQRGTVPGLTRLLGILAEAPVQIVEGFRLRRPTAAFVGSALIGPGLEIGGSESPLAPATATPGPGTRPRTHRAAAAPRHRGQPCPARTPDDPLPEDALIAFYRRHAHRFTVIVPRACDATLAQCWSWPSKPTSRPTPCTACAGWMPATGWAAPAWWASPTSAR